MNAVSTLCASGTVGAAALGYAFGQAPSLSPQPSNADNWGQDATGNSLHFRRKSRHIHTALSTFQGLLGEPKATRTSGAIAAAEDTQPLHPSEIITTNSHCVTSTSTSEVARKHYRTHPQATQSPRQQKTPTTTKSLLDRSEEPVRPVAGHILRERQGHLLDKVSCTTSNPSTNLEGDSQQVTPRNRLVKRSTSVNFSSTPRTADTVSRRWSLRRPATSHQRSQETSDPSTDRLGGSSDRRTTPNTVPRRRRSIATPLREMSIAITNYSPVTEKNEIRRICPESDGAPTLILATSITAKSARLNSTNEDRVYVPLFTSSATVSEADFLSSNTRSFSLGDLIGKQNLGRTTVDNSVSRNKLHRRSSTRASSAPIHRMQIDELAKEEEIKNAPGSSSKRQEVINYNISTTVPQDASNLGYSTAQQIQHVTPSRSAPSSAEKQSASSTINQESLRQQHHPSQRSRLSETPSETTSASDNAIFDNYDDADEKDLQSDTQYDSIRTAMTRNSSGLYSPLLEDVFKRDNSAPSDFIMALRSGVKATVDGYTQMSNESDNSGGHNRNAQLAHGSTPKRKEQHDYHWPHTSTTPHTPMSASPPPLNLGQLEWAPNDEEEDISWLMDEQPSAAGPRTSDKGVAQLSSHIASPTRKTRFLSPHLSPDIGPESDRKNNLFDWAEQQPLERTIDDATPPRPKTVHGKKDTDGRNGRLAGRRVPGSAHARSQSVPVMPEISGKRADVMSKFGTWGIGSKGVTEDWDDDFEFLGPSAIDSEDGFEHGPPQVTRDGSMIVPVKIQEQQRNVLANISLLREWGLLIEELKELRMKAVALDINMAKAKPVFAEIDAMIELADQEANDDGIETSRSLTSSPAFEENTRSPLSDVFRKRARISDISVTSILQLDEDMSRTGAGSNSPSASAKTVAQTRTRKNSEAVARSVIEAIQQKRAPSDVVADLPAPGTPKKKVPFDTATLKHIVPYVNSLVRKMKQFLREAEGLQHSPERRADPSLTQAFISPGSSPVLSSTQLPLYRKIETYMQLEGDQGADDITTSMTSMNLT